MRQIINHPKYCITDTGEVWSFHKKTPKLLKSVDSGNGYLTVSLCENGNQINISIHRCVAEHFLPNPENYPNVCHKDDNKKNNNVSNLFWGTQKHNMEDKIRKGRGAPQDGINNPMFGKDAWNKGLKMPEFSKEHREKLSKASKDSWAKRKGSEEPF